MTRQLAEFNEYDLYPYQEMLKNMSQEYNDRKIDIIYDQYQARRWYDRALCAGTTQTHPTPSTPVSYI